MPDGAQRRLQIVRCRIGEFLERALPHLCLDRAAQIARKRQIDLIPRHRTAAYRLLPDGEGGARRQAAGARLHDRMLSRVAAPGDRARHFRPEPQDRIVGSWVSGSGRAPLPSLV
jgi:hypothetical protein